jgi:hypothetical protein
MPGKNKCPEWGCTATVERGWYRDEAWSAHGNANAPNAHAGIAHTEEG